MSFEEQVQRHRRQIVEQREEGAQLAEQQRAERASLRAALDDFKTQFAGAVDYLTQQGVPTRAVCAVQRGRGGPALLKVHPYKVIVVGGLFLQGGELYYGTLVRSPVRAVLRGVRKGDVIVEVSPYMGPCDGDFVFLPDHAEPTTG
ncbi:hypothetical protein JS562_50450, partial [Agrobacterium sp. S2]|nr:hypothetical protein [Agrobacterium sp. S2]